MSKDYEQFCGIAKASGVLGERWSLLILRDLSVAPRRFTDLHEGLLGIPTSGLTARLRDLQAGGVITRVADEQPGGGVLYTLTPHGDALVPVLDAIGRWGAATMSAPASGDVITDASLASALRSGYRPHASDSTTRYVLHAGPAVAWAEAQAETIVVGAGAPESPADLTIHCGPELRALLAGTLSPSAAVSAGEIRIDGPIELFERFARTFHVPLTEHADAP